MDIFQWWMAALPVAFMVGWVAARVDVRHLVNETRRLPASYLRGISHLLHDERDKAIEAFLEASRADPDTVELNFALGSLFRREGEAERAIRMHKSILDREGITPDQRDDALYELALDYRKAGFLDLAEECLKRLAQTRPSPEISRQLFSLYQVERDWENAIAVMRSAERPDRKTIAHLYCEWADDIATPEGRKEELLGRALEENPRCGRALVMRGHLARERGDDDAAILTWRKLEQCQAEALEVAVAPLMAAHARVGRARQGEKLLRHYLERQPTPPLFEAVFDAISESLGHAAAGDIPEAHLGAFRNPIAALKWLEVKRRHAVEGERETFEKLYLSLSRSADRVLHVCSSCGFGSSRFYWKCPACQEWETFFPRAGE